LALQSFDSDEGYSRNASCIFDIYVFNPILEPVEHI